MKKYKLQISLLKNLRIDILKNYILLAMMSGDINEMEEFDKMLPTIRKDLEKMTIL
jgi:hypothetical protein